MLCNVGLCTGQTAGPVRVYAWHVWHTEEVSAACLGASLVSCPPTSLPLLLM